MLHQADFVLKEAGVEIIGALWAGRKSSRKQSRVISVMKRVPKPHVR